MYSQRQFTPGNNSIARKMINNAIHNAIHNVDTKCYCINEAQKYDKSKFSSVTPTMKTPYKRRISQIINSRLGGSINYGNAYLNQNIQINYLGRSEGMPGGSGTTIKNKF